ncbi:hypothetical protein C8R47DRAFT_1085521 [Mycena vitilis]|nr:hypothetical protein C8R47DRAFT_1085521 [Mycena vitilis]
MRRIHLDPRTSKTKITHVWTPREYPPHEPTRGLKLSVISYGHGVGDGLTGGILRKPRGVKLTSLQGLFVLPGCRLVERRRFIFVRTRTDRRLVIRVCAQPAFCHLKAESEGENCCLAFPQLPLSLPHSQIHKGNPRRTSWGFFFVYLDYNHCFSAMASHADLFALCFPAHSLRFLPFCRPWLLGSIMIVTTDINCVSAL